MRRATRRLTVAAGVLLIALTAAAGQPPPAAPVHVRVRLQGAADDVATRRNSAAATAAAYGGTLVATPGEGAELEIVVPAAQADALSHDPRFATARRVGTPARNDAGTLSWAYSYDGAGDITAAGTDTFSYDLG